MPRKRYEFMLQRKDNGEIFFRTCLVADVRNLVRRLRAFGYAVCGVQEV